MPLMLTVLLITFENTVMKHLLEPQLAWSTEINLVQRLDAQYRDKTIICLDDSVCPCSTMYMIHPRFLAEQLEAILRGDLNRNVIVVDGITAQNASIALNRMLATQ